ncbi:hypothetical protein ARMGADRAFT_593191 [Armillaria gallica]|uniref:Uncharacterized protein n=1 Tax=Armillaria gallica TaxID=47427 RepID=A0A2H3CPI3_ARMGA|nr:hypothetical protein ARMGADRAFT_593191 [Armillaria gallica]
MPDGHLGCWAVPVRRQGCIIDVGVDFGTMVRDFTLLFLQLTSFHRIVTGSFLATKEHSMDAVDPLPRPPGSPFPRDYRTTLAWPPPTSNTAATFFLHSRHHSCGIYCSRGTRRRDEDQFYGRQARRLVAVTVDFPIFTNFTHHGDHRCLQSLQHNDDDVTTLGRCNNPGVDHHQSRRHCRVGAVSHQYHPPCL